MATVFVVLVSAAAIVMLARQQRANQRLLEQASLLDKAQDAIIVSGLDRKVTCWNQGAERLYSWTRDEAMGRVIGIELLKDSVTHPTDREVLATIGASASRGAEMVRQVLSYARGLESRRVEIKPAELVADVERIARDMLLKTINIRTNVEPGLPPLLGDPTQFHQVLLNLCVNARDAMPAGGQLTIGAALVMVDDRDRSAGVDLPPGAYVKIEVADTGTGIAAEIADKILDPFFTTKEPGKGTGLGLSTSLTIVKSHGGQIRSVSELGRGTRFAIYLPASASAGGESLISISDIAPRPPGGGHTVLVVDDEAAIRMITQRTLEASGYRVLLASDGAEAIAAFGANRGAIAAVMLDMTMPVLAGVPTIQALARIDSSVPIIAVSGISANEQPVRAASAQVKMFLPKPFTSDTLLKALQQVLN